ncbi:MAG TPA: heavy-metal-associated domain-containing protein [Phycisphaerae bacterium]|nr:heavy-metal-associated domain-containing protein [Phycisphaerae bacterium]
MRGTSLQISGMHCDGCVERVRQALGGLAGVVIGEVRIGTAEVEFDESKCDLLSIVDAIRSVGGLDVTGFQARTAE